MTTDATHRGAHRRLRPLQAGIALQAFMLWLPVEKLFMSEIGFDPATIGLVAGAYAVMVPVLEVPSGILADRWSRRGVLGVAGVALAACDLIGGLSHGVATYLLSALALGVYFAMYSGTVEAMVYDTLVEETGTGGDFERQLGRARFIEAMALVASSLAGGWVASLLSTRATSLLTVPFALASVVALLRFREPRLHRPTEPAPLVQHVATMFRTLTRTRCLIPVIVLSVLAAMLLQTVFEFGPLWLVAVSAPAVLFGPYWAALVSTHGLGGLLAGRLDFTRPVTGLVVGGLLTGAAAALTVVRDVVLITGAQILLGLLLMAITVHVTRLLNDAVASTVRAGVASGVSTLTWLVFLPFSLLFGALSDALGVRSAALPITGLVALTARRWEPAACGRRRVAALEPA